eukprot:403351938
MGNIGCKSCGDCMRRDKQSEFDDQKIQSLPTPRDQVIEKKSHYKQELQATDFSPVSGKGAESQARESTECSLYTRESFDCQSQKQKYNKTNKQGLFNINGRANTQSTQSRKQSQRDIKQEFKLTTEYTSNSKFSKNLIKDQSGFGRKFSAQEHQQQRKVNNLEFNGILNSNRYEDQNPYYFQKRLRIKKQQDNFSNILQALQQSDLYIKSIIKIQAWYRMINVRVKYIQKLNKINKQLTPSSGLTKHGQQSSYSHITEFKAYSSTHRDKNQFKKGSRDLQTRLISHTIMEDWFIQMGPPIKANLSMGNFKVMEFLILLIMRSLRDGGYKASNKDMVYKSHNLTRNSMDIGKMANKSGNSPHKIYYKYQMTQIKFKI